MCEAGSVSLRYSFGILRNFTFFHFMTSDTALCGRRGLGGPATGHRATGSWAILAAFLSFFMFLVVASLWARGLNAVGAKNDREDFPKEKKHTKNTKKNGREAKGGDSVECRI